jgi:hypothetical protein
MRAAILFAMAAIALSSVPLLWHEETQMPAPQQVHTVTAHPAAAGSLAEASGHLAHHSSAVIHAPQHAAR